MGVPLSLPSSLCLVRCCYTTTTLSNILHFAGAPRLDFFRLEWTGFSEPEMSNAQFFFCKLFPYPHLTNSHHSPWELSPVSSVKVTPQLIHLFHILRSAAVSHRHESKCPVCPVCPLPCVECERTPLLTGGRQTWPLGRGAAGSKPCFSTFVSALELRVIFSLLSEINSVALCSELFLSLRGRINSLAWGQFRVNPQERLVEIIRTVNSKAGYVFTRFSNTKCGKTTLFSKEFVDAWSDQKLWQRSQYVRVDLPRFGRMLIHIYLIENRKTERDEGAFLTV